MADRKDMISPSSDIAIIGGGISGLVAAWHLQKAGKRICLLEKESAVGGVTRTLAKDGFLLEQGPFNVLVRDPAFEGLLQDLSSDIEMIEAGSAAKVRYIYRHGRLIELPTNPFKALTTRLVSTKAKMRVLAEPLIGRKPDVDDPTIADFATRRFGPEIAQTVLGAAVRGIFASDINQLSLKSCFPAIAEIDRQRRSLLIYGLGMPFRRTGKALKAKRRWRHLVSTTTGLGGITQALGTKLGDCVHTGCEVMSLQQESKGYTVSYRGRNGAQTIMTKGIVLATSCQHAANLLPSLTTDRASQLARVLQSIETVPLVVLNIGLRKNDVRHPLRGFGFLVPPDEAGISIMGCLWASSVFPNQAPPDQHLIRVFLGGARDRQVATRPDEELLSLALGDLGEVLKIRGQPTLVNICRHPSAVPQYVQGHSEKVQEIHQLLQNLPGLHLVGNYLEGVSLNDCVRLATEAAVRINLCPPLACVP